MLADTEVEDFLEHYGVKGQHWGIINKKQQANNKDRTKRGSQKEKRILQANKNTKLRDKKHKSSIKRGWAHLNKAFGQVQSDRAREAISAKRAATILRKQQEHQQNVDAVSRTFVGLLSR